MPDPANNFNSLNRRKSCVSWHIDSISWRWMACLYSGWTSLRITSTNYLEYEQRLMVPGIQKSKRWYDWNFQSYTWFLWPWNLFPPLLRLNENAGYFCYQNTCALGEAHIRRSFPKVSSHGLPIPFFTFCSKLIESVRMIAYEVRLSSLEAIQQKAWATASTSSWRLILYRLHCLHGWWLHLA